MAYICKAFLRGGQDGQIVLEVVDDSTGARNTTIGSLEVNIADLVGQEVKARWTEGCDEEGEPRFALMLRGAWTDTLPEGASTD